MKKAALAITLLLTACGGQNDQTSSAETVAMNAVLQAPESVPAQVPFEPQKTLPAAARMIIRTATLTLIVEDAAEALRQIVSLVEAQGGYLAETRQWQESTQTRASATLKVPAEKLAEVLGEIRKYATRVDQETIAGQDVSEEFTDLAARLTNLRATEAELRQLLATVRERTQKAADVLEVHRELASIRGQIESVQGRSEYLQQLTAMSTVQLSLVPASGVGPIIQTRWSPVATVKDAARALVASTQALGTLLIWLIVYVAPLLAMVLLLLLGAKRLTTAARRRVSSG